MLVSRVNKYKIKLKYEHEKINKDFLNILTQKNEEIYNLNKLKEEYNLSINLLKAKETEN